MKVIKAFVLVATIAGLASLGACANKKAQPEPDYAPVDTGTYTTGK